MNISDKIKEVEKEYPVKVIYVIKIGSKLYGTNSESSDTDYIGLFVPDPLSVLLKRDLEHYCKTTGQDNSKNTKDDIDIQFWSIYKFLNLVKKGETGALDLLYSLKAKHFDDICVYIDNDYMSLIYDNISQLTSKNLQAFIGYCLGQAKRYNIKGARYSETVLLKDSVEAFIVANNIDITKPLKILSKEIEECIYQNNLKYISFVFAQGPKRFIEENVWYLEVLGIKHILDISIQEFLERLNKLFNSFGNRAIAAADGIDNKALSHATRVLLECKELLETGSIQFPLQFADLVKNIKYHPDLNNGDGSTININGKHEALTLENLMYFLDLKLNEVNTLLEVSPLRDSVEQDLIDKILLNILDLYVKKGEK